MPRLPDRPFLTADFSPTGGGIDYLGMRWVSLKILADQLIPGINNATSDFGVYCLATWIPWKFRHFCTNRKDFVLSNFRRFEEAVGVAISHGLRSDSPSVAKFGEAHGKIGVQQKLELPSELSFEKAKRTRSTSIYAAPLYGPSLRYLGLIQGYALAEDDTSTEIPLVVDDAVTNLLAETVDISLSQSDALGKVTRLETATLTGAELDDLGMNGLNPAFYRTVPTRVKTSFLAKLLPTEEPNGRTLTARLLVATLKQQSGLDLDEIRAVWHTGRFPDGSELRVTAPELVVQRERWAVFQTRQYQRYVIELFMKCFELALARQLSSIDEITREVVLPCSSAEDAPRTVRDQVSTEARHVSQAKRFETVSEHWNRDVHGDHPAYVWIEANDELDECVRALRMMARWWLQTCAWLDWERHQELFVLGGEDRLSIKWFFNWVAQRLDQPLHEFVKDVFEQLVFGQHVRVALSRFDGQSQRLRFVLGDEGIVPTRSAADKLGKSLPGWTADRLWSFVGLLRDLSVVDELDDGGFGVGELAGTIS